MEKHVQQERGSDAPCHSVVVVIPAYNEEQTIKGVIDGFDRALPNAFLCVVDNNSSDATRAVAAHSLSHGRGTILSEPRQGKGFALRRAFRETDADVFIVVDADMTYLPTDAQTLMEPISKGLADMVVGDRISGGDYARENKRGFHGFGNRLVVSTINRLFKTKLRDVMSGYRAISGRMVRHMPILGDGFEIETEITLFALDRRFSILEIPISYKDRPPGSSSKLNTLRDGLRVMVTILNMLRNHRPLRFFGALSLLLLFGGLLVGILPIYEYFKFAYVYRVPSAILATGLVLLSAASFGIGLVLDTVKTLDRARFEIQLLAERPLKPIQTRHLQQTIAPPTKPPPPSQ